MSESDLSDFMRFYMTEKLSLNEKGQILHEYER